MTWQDVVIASVQVVFAVALFPSLLSDEKPARATCLLTALCLYALGITYFTLQLYGAVASVVLCGVLWTILLLQGRRS